MEYYEKRKNMLYYSRVKAMLEWITRAPGSSARSILDVGPADTPVASWGYFNRRFTVDIHHDPKLPGVTHFKGDFMELDSPSDLEVITCLQVLEHLQDPTAFLRRILERSTWAIISVPYRWPHGRERGHVQDPVSLLKVLSWSYPEEPQFLERVQDRTERMIVVYGPHNPFIPTFERSE